jgi:aryl-alcohol dehydrogenase-like predicted oxidoreductase
MRMRPFGQTGLKVSVLGFGALQIGDPTLAEPHVARVLNHVLDTGLTLIDTARSYGLSEERIGRHLAARRDEFVLSTKVGYDIPGLPDWTHATVVAGIDAARDRLRTDVIDIVHLHSCGQDVLRAGEVTRALGDCIRAGKIRVAAYSGDDAALRVAAGSDAFRGFQASVNLCDQQALPVLRAARERGCGTIAKRSLAGRAWAGGAPVDEAQAGYRARFAAVRSALQPGIADWDGFALRFTAFADGVDSVIVGGASTANVDRNVAAVSLGPLAAEEQRAVHAVYAAHAREWGGLV